MDIRSEVRLKGRSRRSHHPHSSLYGFVLNLSKAAVPDCQGRHHVQRHGGARARHQTGTGGGAATSGCARMVMRRGDQVPGAQGTDLRTFALFFHHSLIKVFTSKAYGTISPPLFHGSWLTYPCLLVVQYVVFPGNVGDARALLTAVTKLRGESTPSSSSSSSSVGKVKAPLATPSLRSSRTLDMLHTGESLFISSPRQ